jgi:hypothetical protein
MAVPTVIIARSLATLGGRVIDVNVCDAIECGRTGNWSRSPHNRQPQGELQELSMRLRLPPLDPGRKLLNANSLVRPRIFLVAMSWFLIAVACRSVPSRATPGAPRDQRTSEEEARDSRTLVQIDSEVFDAVVRAQASARGDDYPRPLEQLRYDSRPYGTESGYPEVFAGVQGVDPSLSFPRVERSESEISFIVDNRKKILQENDVAEGGPFTVAQCAGAGVPIPPPPAPRRGSASTRRAKPQDVHAGCPKTTQYYVTVGLPLRGQPPGVRNLRDTRGRSVRLDGDVWTTLVDELEIGPGGWTRSHYAWLFKRDRSRQLHLESTILISVTQ